MGEKALENLASHCFVSFLGVCGWKITIELLKMQNKQNMQPVLYAHLFDWVCKYLDDTSMTMKDIFDWLSSN